MNRKEKYEAKARAYELVTQHIQRMLDNEGFAEENIVTIRELNTIVDNLEKKRNRKIEIGLTPPKPRKPKAKVSPIQVKKTEPQKIDMDWGLDGARPKRGRR